MNHWPYVIASYVLVIAGTAALLWQSYRAMRSAEGQAEQLKRKP
ncbi:MAG: hypothetical protein U5J78_07955 [Parasphingorhabdus sp.]|nr:hypothetical protein [Parasphingorhabdus sp.]